MTPQNSDALGSPIEVLFEIADRLGADHTRDCERFRLHWEEHIQKSREMILTMTSRVTSRSSITILGAGTAYNIPLDELTRQFDKVRLVDIDRNGLQRALDGLTREARSKVELHAADATGGLALGLLELGLDVIRSSETASEAMTGLISLLEEKAAHIAFDSARIEAWKASCVVSSGLASQSTIFPAKVLIEAYEGKFEQDIADDSAFYVKTRELRDHWVRQHGELLASLVTADGRVYWADTVAETPCLAEFGPPQLNAVVDSVVLFLENSYLKTFLTDAGKEILSERFNQGLNVQPAKSAAERRERTALLVGSFPDGLDTMSKRRLAWAIMTLVGENAIAPKRELELLRHIVNNAEKMNPNALQPILRGGLRPFFPPSLEPDGEAGRWLWINDPEGTVTLDGSSYYVEAHILKPVR